MDPPSQFVIPSEVEGSLELRLGGHQWTRMVLL